MVTVRRERIEIGLSSVIVFFCIESESMDDTEVGMAVLFSIDILYRQSFLFEQFCGKIQSPPDSVFADIADKIRELQCDTEITGGFPYARKYPTTMALP